LHSLGRHRRIAGILIAMDAVTVIVALLMVAGLAGALLPVLPGTPLILLGAGIYAYATDFARLGWGRLGILAALGVLGYGLGHIAGAVGVRRYGGSGWAVAGAVLGVIVGIWFGPLGLLVGPMIGAIGGELLRTRDLRGSVRSGIGAAVGMIGGALAHFVIALTMVGLFVWWAWVN
jgi:uncharacterized protein YqgC (DUF456 family)